MTATPVIDVHSHWVPPGYAAALRSLAGSGIAHLTRIAASVLEPGEGMASLDARVEEMDRAGVDVSVLSLPPPGATLGTRAQRRDMARMANDEFLEAASSTGGRFAVLAALPFPDPDDALAELERVAAHACARGVILYTVGEGRTVDHSELEPVYRRMAELGLPALAHPAVEALGEPWNDWMLGATLGPVVSSSLGVARLILAGVLDRVPGLDLIVPHLGGVLPYLAQRFDDFGTGNAEHDVSWYLGHRLYVDTCSYHPPAMRCAEATCGANRLVLGTDYPIRGTLTRGVDEVRATFDGLDDRAAVLGGTAARWFG